MITGLEHHALHNIDGEVQIQLSSEHLSRRAYSPSARGHGKFSRFAVSQEVSITGRL